MELEALKRRGRPPAISQEERRRRIVAAAEETFTFKGYSDASMDDIVRACGMSKKTVYEAFGSKELLFREVLASSLDDAPRFDLTNAAASNGRDLFKSVLTSMAAFILSPRQVALTRLVLAESSVSPGLGAAFYEAVVWRGQAILAEAIRCICVSAPDEALRSEELADLLIGTLLGPRFFSALLGRTETPTQEEIMTRIDWLLDILDPALGLGKQESV